ncbi:MAG TPA: hypothetical protein VMZ27_11585, partial [Candidatus Saccharimonadales bacterium]|nr:hypothetical protein [Candidatus Saccharimonadales bacterium]
LAKQLSEQLLAKPAAAFVRGEIPLALFGKSLPKDIHSSNVYVIRPAVSSGLERHPNSHQRSVALVGEGVFELGIDSPASHAIANKPASRVAERWASIPPNTWHQAIAGEDYWTVVTFHTAPDRDIINERK